MRFTLYAGCDLIHVQAIVQTQKDARALLYHAGLTCNPEGKSVSWIGLDDKAHRADAAPRDAAPQKVRNRTIALETGSGGIAVFPPPHRYFYPLDEAYNLGFTWWGAGFMVRLEEFGIGIRQDRLGDRRWIPWFNAPPGTEQKLGVFWLPSLDRGGKLFDHVKAYTNGDRFPALPGHKTFTSHYHIEHTTRYIEELAKDSSSGVPKAVRKPEFVDVFKNAGIQIVHLAEFHNRLGPARRDHRKTLPMLKAMHDECARLSDDEFLLLPGEEPNVHLGGHWISFFPRPVMWVLKRAKDKPFIEEHPQYGRVYHVGSADEVLKLFEMEKGLMWAAHPRIKSSTGYPDRYQEETFFKSDHYLGGEWKAMPADLSRSRLGWRVLNLLNDTANWGAKKYILGEVDIFEVDNTTEFYAHANVNYLRLESIPRYGDGWAPVLKALRDGAFFISTGEVLLPQFTVGAKASGKKIKLSALRPSQARGRANMDFPDGLRRGRHRGWREGLSPTDRPLRHRTLRETNPLRDARPLRQTLGAHRSMGRGRQRSHLPANLAGVNQALGQAQFRLAKRSVFSTKDDWGQPSLPVRCSIFKTPLGQAGINRGIFSALPLPQDRACL